MLDFLRGGADVLVCTTIVESGLDIPSANTLIVERADELGLAQLYQIRGRVGRSRERAYAYLLYPSAAALSEEAASGSPRSPTTRSSAPASRSRCATSRSAAPATCSATTSRATWPRWASSSTWGCSTRPCGCWPATPPRRPPSRCAWTCRWTPTCRATTCPYEAAKIEMHRRVAGAREIAELIMLREELADRFGPMPDAAREPDPAPGRPHQARPRGRAAVDFTGGRMSVTPIELDSTGAKALRERVPDAVYESGRETVRSGAGGAGRALPGRRRRC